LRKKESGGSPSAIVLLLFSALFLAILLELSRRAFRRSQLFAPSREPLISWDPSDYGIPPEAVRQLELNRPGRKGLHGWYCTARNPVASVLFFHGNAGNLTNMAHMIAPLLDIGVNVLMFDYQGYGKSGGRPELRGVLEDGMAMARLHDQLRPYGVPSIAWGFSLGGAIASDVVTRIPFDGLILQSTFTSLRDMARLMFPGVAVHRLSGSVLDTMRALRQLDLPLLLLHGSADEVVPHAMSHQIFDAYRGPKTLRILEGRLHKDLFQPAPAEAVENVRQFLLSLPSRRAGARPAEPPERP
jgi:fermentation-respiration switch protein FrsA (DUF1100 family)